MDRSPQSPPPWNGCPEVSMSRRLLCLLFAAALPLAASKPTMNELLVTLSNRRTTVEESLQQAVRACPPDSPKLREAQRRYRLAREASNEFLDRLALDLEQDDLQREKHYRVQLETTQKQVDDLQAYLDGTDCQGQGRAKVLPLVAAALEHLPSFIEWLGHLVKQHREAARARREALVIQLRTMRWKPYSEVVRDAAPPMPPARPVAQAAVLAPVRADGQNLRPVPPEGGLKVVPVLRLETGQHTAAIRALAVSPDGSLALTASEDKTARVWEVATGRLLRTIRPTVAAGKVGMLYAAAIAPDGRTAALGGWTRAEGDGGQQIFLVNLRTGAFLRILEVGPQVVNFLAFSPDGQRLVAHLGGTYGLRVFRTSDGAQIGSDADYAQPSYRGAFDAQGRYAATSDDGFIRLYDASFNRIRKVPAPAGGAFGLAFSPDGSLLAVGFADSPRVEVLKADDLGPAFTPAPGPRNLGLVAWSADGQTLYGAGGEDFGPAANVLRAWSRGGRGPATEAPLSRATVSDLCPLPSGVVAFAAQDPVWGVVDAAGRPLVRVGEPQADFREARKTFAVDAQAERVSLPGRMLGAQPLAFSLPEQALVPTQPLPRARTEAPGLRIEGWRDGDHPTLNGTGLALEPSEWSRSLAVAPDGGRFLLGTDWYLRAYGRQGTERWKVHTPAAVWGLGLRQDGRVAVAMLADGTFRWYRTEDGQLLMSLYVAADQRWVLWTPTGFFAVSPGGESLVGWQVNRINQAADFFPVSHFRDRFYKPELMPALLDTLDETAALRRLQGSGGAPVVAAPGVQDLPPVLEILDPAEGAALSPGPATFHVSLRTYGGAPALKGFQVFLDGARVPPSRGLRPQQTGKALDGVTREFPVEIQLPPRPVTVTIQAELSDGRLSRPVDRRVRVVPPVGPAPAAAAPILRVLAVGVTRFANPRFDLQFPAKDASDIGAFFQGQAGKLFRRVDVELLTNAEATEQHILKAMDDLAASSTPDSCTVYFFSSHGGTKPDRTGYFLVPYDFGAGSWGVDGRAIRQRMDATQGRTLLLLDTCHSGNVLGAGMMRSLDGDKRTQFINELLQSSPGMVVLSSSAGYQTSLESPLWNNGAFTKALVEGLRGAADSQHTGRITTGLLDAYVRQRVSDLTQGKQTPVAAQSTTTRGFPVALE